MDGCNMDDLFAFAYYHETIESWERDQADYRELSEQMDQQWDLAKEWGLPPQYSEPPSHFGDVWRLIVKDLTGEIPLGKRLNEVAHSVVSLVVQLRIAAKHDAGLVVEQHIDTLLSEYAPLQQACEESTDQELSWDVKRTSEARQDDRSNADACPEYAWRELRPQPKFAIANRSPSDPASVGARLISYNSKTSRTTPSTGLVSVVGRLLATHRGYTDAGSVQAKAEYQFSAVAQQSMVHRHRSAVPEIQKPTPRRIKIFSR